LPCLPAWRRARHGADYGQHGAVFAVIEPDLLAMIRNKLTRLQDGRARADEPGSSRAAARRVFAGPIRLPDRPATTPRSWIYDPAITIDHDVFDTKGNAIARRPAGQPARLRDRAPEPRVHRRRRSRPARMGDAALYRSHRQDRHGERRAARGDDALAPRFYFDQGGYLTARFGIHAVPAVVEPAGKVMRVSGSRRDRQEMSAMAMFPLRSVNVRFGAALLSVALVACWRCC
jgi:conjugal transfer pilus assembly protein TraW